MGRMKAPPPAKPEPVQTPPVPEDLGNAEQMGLFSTGRPRKAPSPRTAIPPLPEPPEESLPPVPQGTGASQKVSPGSGRPPGRRRLVHVPEEPSSPDPKDDVVDRFKNPSIAKCVLCKTKESNLRSDLIEGPVCNGCYKKWVEETKDRRDREWKAILEQECSKGKK